MLLTIGSNNVEAKKLIMLKIRNHDAEDMK